MTADPVSATGAGGGVIEPAPRPRLVRVRRGVMALYVALLIAYCARYGVPTTRILLIGPVIVLLLIACIGYSLRRVLQVVIDWAPFTAVLLAYDQTRRLPTALGIGVHEHDIVRAERWLFGGTEPTIFLQHHLYDPHQVYWYDAFFTLVYTTHFAATPVLAAILWLRNRATWLRFVSRIVVLSVAGLITYIAFPEAPPWLAAQDGLTAPVARSSARGWIWLHAGNVNHLLAKAQSDGSNPVAAMPSMHFAVATTVAIAIAWHLPRRFRWLMVLYPLAMGFALVYLGEHWVIDIVVGLIYAIVVHFVMNRVEKWVAMRRERTDQLQPGDPAVDVIPV